MDTPTNIGAAVAAARAIALPDVCTVEDLARHLRKSPASVRRMLRSGQLPGVRLGNRWYVSRDALLDAIRSRPQLRLVDANSPSDGSSP